MAKKQVKKPIRAPATLLLRNRAEALQDIRVLEKFLIDTKSGMDEAQYRLEIEQERVREINAALKMIGE